MAGLNLDPDQPSIIERRQKRENWMKNFFNKLSDSQATVKCIKDCEELCDKGQTHRLARLRGYIKNDID